VLADALAAIDCAVEDIIERHSHAIVIGRVEAVRISSASALVYWHGDYAQLARGGIDCGFAEDCVGG